MELKPKVEMISVGLKIVLLSAMLFSLVGCGGYVETGYYGYSDPVEFDSPDVYLFSDGYYDRGRDIHGYGHRGRASRSSTHDGRRH